MKNKKYLSEPTYDFDYYFGFFNTILNIVLLIIVVYFLVKIYGTLMQFLKNKNGKNS